VALGLAGLQRLRAVDATGAKTIVRFVLRGNPLFQVIRSLLGSETAGASVLRRSRLFPRTSRCPLKQGNVALASCNVLIFNVVNASFWQGDVILASCNLLIYKVVKVCFSFVLGFVRHKVF
jgi:hypothetical protein